MDNSRAKFSLTDTCRYFSFRQVSHILFLLLLLLLFVLKIEELLCRIIKDFIYSYATTSSSCLLPLFILLLFFHFFSHLILLAEQLKQQFMTIIIHYMNIFFSSSPIVPSTCVQPLYAWIHACHVFYLTSRALICRLWQISYHHQLQH